MVETRSRPAAFCVYKKCRRGYGPDRGSCYSAGLAMMTTSLLGPVLGAGFAQVIVPRRLAAWVAGWDSVMDKRSWSLGALRGSCHVATFWLIP